MPQVVSKSSAPAFLLRQSLIERLSRCRVQMTDKVENLLAAGVLDPAKVTRSGLMNACGIAGIMLTTQVLPFCLSCCT